MRLPTGKKPVSESARLIGFRIAWLRYENKMTQRSLAAAVGMSGSALCDVENAQHRILAQNLYKISQVFEVSMDVFFTPVEEFDDV